MNVLPFHLSIEESPDGILACGRVPLQNISQNIETATQSVQTIISCFPNENILFYFKCIAQNEHSVMEFMTGIYATFEEFQHIQFEYNSIFETQ